MHGTQAEPSIPAAPTPSALLGSSRTMYPHRHYAALHAHLHTRTDGALPSLAVLSAAMGSRSSRSGVYAYECRCSESDAGHFDTVARPEARGQRLNGDRIEYAVLVPFTAPAFTGRREQASEPAVSTVASTAVSDSQQLHSHNSRAHSPLGRGVAAPKCDGRPGCSTTPNNVKVGSGLTRSAVLERLFLAQVR